MQVSSLVTDSVLPATRPIITGQNFMILSTQDWNTMLPRKYRFSRWLKSPYQVERIVWVYTLLEDFVAPVDHPCKILAEVLEVKAR